MKQIRVEFLDKADILDLKDLYTEVFEKNISNEQINWLYLNNPYVTATELFSIVARDLQNIIVAHTAFIPVNYVFEGKSIKGALSVGTMVSSKQVGTFAQIYSELETKMIDCGFDMLVAFPNECSYPFFIKQFKYIDRNFECLQLNKIQDNLNCADVYFKQDRSMVTNSLEKDYLKWRLSTLSQKQYHKIKIGCHTFYYKIYLDSEVDIIAIDRLDDGISSSDIIKFIEITQVSTINAYSTDIEFTRFLMSIGFSIVNTRNNFVIKSLSNLTINKKIFCQMIDSDIF